MCILLFESGLRALTFRDIKHTDRARTQSVQQLTDEQPYAIATQGLRPVQALTDGPTERILDGGLTRRAELRIKEASGERRAKV